MKRILYLFIALGCLCGLSACFEDKSTEADHVIPEIVIDTTGIGGAVKVRQYEAPYLAPVVSKEGVDPSNFSYKWLVSLETPAFDTHVLEDYMCIDTDAVLDSEIVLTSATKPYRLWFQATDNTSGLRKDMFWDLYVVDPYNEGLLVAETTDERTTDLAFIEGEQFTVGYEEGKEPQTYHGIFSKANGTTYEGLLTQLCSMRRAQRDKNRWWTAIGQNTMTLLDLEYKMKARDLDMSYDKDITVAPTQLSHFSSGYRYYVIVNDGVIWPVEYDWVTNQYLSTSADMTFNEEDADGLMRTKSSKVDNYVAFTHSANNVCAVWYDKELGRFFYQDETPESSMKVFDSSLSTAFDPNNCPSLETLYGAVGMEDDLYMIMRNTSTGKYQIYVFSQDAAGVALYDIPTNEMDNATGFVVSENGKCVYFTTEHDVYAIPLAASEIAVTKIHSFASEEITHFSMLRQGQFIASPYYGSSLDGHEYTLIVGLWNGSSGTLKTIPITSPMVGGIDVSGIETYSGFGKILTTLHQLN